MKLLEKRLSKQVEQLGKHKKVRITTAFYHPKTNRKVGTITQGFTCWDFTDGRVVSIVNPIYQYQFLTVFFEDGSEVSKQDVAWNKAISILERELTPWGRLLNSVIFW